MDLSFILKYVRTAEEKNELINLLEQLLENTFRRDVKEIENSSFTKRASEIIHGEIETKGIGNDREEIEKFLQVILSAVRALPEIKLSIAVSPTESLIKKLKDWAQANGFEYAIFNLEIKSEIVAGAEVMSDKGEYADYSLASQLNKFFTDKKEEILTLL